MAQDRRSRGRGGGLFALGLAALLLVDCRPPPAPAGLAAREPASSKLYVAVNGDDRWSGALDSPNAAKTDGPFATLGRARDAARALRAAKGPTGPLEILVREGTYFLSEPFVLGPEDSGTAEAPLTITAYPREHPTISGGVRIDGWKETEVHGKRAWTTEVPGVREGRLWFRELFVNDERRPRTRLPKKGYYHPVEVPEIKPDALWTEGQHGFRFAPGDLRAWSSLADVEVVALHFWVESRLPVATIDEKNNLATFRRRSVFRLTERAEPAPLARYYVENVYEALDSPGRWYLNRATGVLTYLPRPGEEPTSTRVIAPRLEQLVRLEGDPGAGRFVDHVHLKGLAFRDAEWSLGDRKVSDFQWHDVAGAIQAAVNVPGAIWMRGTRDSTLEDCSIAAVGGYGVELAEGCQRDQIIGCDIGNLGAGGVKIGETVIPTGPRETGHNTVTDCHIHDGGFIYRSAVGVWVGQSAGNVIAHNHIHDLDYTGISVGWSWGYKPSAARDNLIEKNHVHDVGRGVLSDVGAVYTLGVSPGTVIRGNVFHDITAYAYGGWGIYFDEGTSGVVAERNVVHRARSGSFFQNYGKDNVVSNNILALAGEEGQLIRGKEEGSISFTRNLVYFREGGVLGWNWSKGDFEFDRNLYWDARGKPVTFAGASLRQWNERGKDQRSIVADPLFVDPEHGDFTLRAGSPALATGFEPIDVRDVGPRR